MGDSCNAMYCNATHGMGDSCNSMYYTDRSDFKLNYQNCTTTCALTYGTK